MRKTQVCSRLPPLKESDVLDDSQEGLLADFLHVLARQARRQLEDKPAGRPIVEVKEAVPGPPVPLAATSNQLCFRFQNHGLWRALALTVRRRGLLRGGEPRAKMAPETMNIPTPRTVKPETRQRDSRFISLPLKPPMTHPVSRHSVPVGMKIHRAKNRLKGHPKPRRVLSLRRKRSPAVAPAPPAPEPEPQLVPEVEEPLLAPADRDRQPYDGETAIKLYLREIGQVKLLTPAGGNRTGGPHQKRRQEGARTNDQGQLAPGGQNRP